MSLLTVISGAMNICGFAAPSAIVNSTDGLVSQFAGLLRVEGDDLSKQTAWRNMKADTSVTGDGVETLFDLPSDFTKFAPGYIMWEQDGTLTPLKQVSDSEMVGLKSQSAWLTYPVWRLFGDQIEFYPALPDGRQVNFEYRPDYWIVSSDLLTRKARWTDDGDLFLVPEQVLTLGLVWRFKHAKGFSYAEDFEMYKLSRERYIFNDQPRPVIRVGGRAGHPGLMTGMVGDTPPIVVS